MSGRATQPSVALALSALLWALGSLGCAELLGIDEYQDGTTTGTAGAGAIGGQAGSGGTTGGSGGAGGTGAQGGTAPTELGLAWLGHLKGAGSDNIHGLDFDAGGDLGVCGRFSQELSYDLDGTATVPVQSQGGFDIHVLKVDQLGGHRWSSVFGNSNDLNCAAIAFDGQAWAYTTGSIIGAVDFGSESLDGGAATTGYVVAIDDTAVVRSASQFSSTGGVQNPWAMDVAPNNTRWSVGFFRGQATFAGESATSGDAIYAGFAAYEGVGDTGGLIGIGADGTGDTEEQHAYTVHAASANDVYVGGHNEGTLTANGTTAVATPGTADPFVAQLDETGAVSRVIGFESPGLAQTHAVATDGDGNLVIAGLFTTSLDFEDRQLTTEHSGWAAFIAKLDPSWTPRWAFDYGLDGDQEARDVAFDAAGNIYALINFFGAVEVGTAIITADGNQDGLLLALAPDGSYQWHVWFASEGYVFLAGVDVHPTSNRLAVAGHFEQILTIHGDSGPLGAPLTSEGGTDGFLASFDLPSGG